MRKFFSFILFFLIVNPLFAVTARDSATARSATKSRNAATIQSQATRKTAVVARTVKIRKNPVVRSRAAATDAVVSTTSSLNSSAIVSTRTGAAYDKCKTSYFTCMDQFCAVKNENYRRCSCSDKVYDLDAQQQTLTSAADQLNDFNNNLTSVGLSAEEVTAMRQASEGEDAMTADKSASKQLLDAIMNSISQSGSTRVGNSGLQQLNSISFTNSSGVFGSGDNGQALASYNGTTLYSAIYAQCRDVVRDNCTDDALQRAVTAYLMAIENDCGTVAKMIDDNRIKMTAAVHKSDAMLNLARVENRQNHNSSDATDCLNEVEAVITNSEVCGTNYNKCLDNGEFIDKDTGKPFSGVKNFYELENLLAFDEGSGNDQKLTQNPNNRSFVQGFVARNKQFAEDALDKCSEIADTVWSDYLDKAMLEIHYAQVAKVEEIKRGCFDFVNECYVNGDMSVTDFMKDITNVSGSTISPEVTTLTSQLCQEYTQSCDRMFGGNIVSDYIARLDNKDIITTCRSIAKECFAGYGGTSYNNFYNPASGLSKQGNALDWFTLYERNGDKKIIKSLCAQKLMDIEECSSSDELLEEIFGGMDKLVIDNDQDGKSCFDYGLLKTKNLLTSDPQCSIIRGFIDPSGLRQAGVATEIYNLIIGRLRDNCKNFGGKFYEFKYLDNTSYCTRNSTQCAGISNPCRTSFSYFKSVYYPLLPDYNFLASPNLENMCPYNYENSVDVQSWGICSCWGNGGRRPDNNTHSPGCYQTIPSKTNLKQNDSKQLCPLEGSGATVPACLAGDGKKYLATDPLCEGATTTMECACPDGAENCENGLYKMDRVPSAAY